MAAGVPEPYGKNTQNVYRYLTRPIATTIELDLQDVSEQERIDIIQRLLLEAQDEFNRKVLGVVPAEEMRTRRLVAGAVILGVAAAFIFGFVSLWRYFSHVTRQSQGVEKVNHRKYLWGYVLILPALVLIIGWSYLPLIGGAAMAAMDYQLVIDSAFIGVDNSAAALYDDRFLVRPQPHVLLRRPLAGAGLLAADPAGGPPRRGADRAAEILLPHRLLPARHHQRHHRHLPLETAPRALRHGQRRHAPAQRAGPGRRDAPQARRRGAVAVVRLAAHPAADQARRDGLGDEAHALGRRGRDRLRHVRAAVRRRLRLCGMGGAGGG